MFKKTEPLHDVCSHTADALRTFDFKTAREVAEALLTRLAALEQPHAG